MKNAYRILVRTCEAKRDLEDFGRGGRIHIIMDHTEIKCEGADWIHLIHDRDQERDVVNPVVRKPLGSMGNFLAS
jgi:hypothetical protein